MLGVAPGQHLTAQQITTVRIGQRQRLTTRAVAGEESALEIDRPRHWRPRRPQTAHPPAARARLSRRFTPFLPDTTPSGILRMAAGRQQRTHGMPERAAFALKAALGKRRRKSASTGP
jgi:hypothetical protein